MDRGRLCNRKNSDRFSVSINQRKTLCFNDPWGIPSHSTTPAAYVVGPQLVISEVPEEWRKHAREPWRLLFPDLDWMPQRMAMRIKCWCPKAEVVVAPGRVRCKIHLADVTYILPCPKTT